MLVINAPILMKQRISFLATPVLDEYEYIRFNSAAQFFEFVLFFCYFNFFRIKCIQENLLIICYLFYYYEYYFFFEWCEALSCTTVRP